MFLEEEGVIPEGADAIHSQSISFTPDMLVRLEKECAVKPYTIQQKMGEAVFIPAGCAHQVSKRLDFLLSETNWFPR